MGSEILTAVVEHVGQVTTNPDGVSPEPSKPIEQRNLKLVTTAPSQPVEQFLEVETTDEFSKPVEQVVPDSFNEDGTRPDDCFLEQKGQAERASEGGDSPIEQLIFDASNQPAEQRILSRDLTSAQPVQQDPKKSNTIDVTQFDFVDSIFPPCNSVKNPVDTNILWRVKDAGFDFDIGTLIFTVEGIEVQDRDSFEVTAIANGIQIEYDPPENFSFDTLVEIFFNIDDNDDPPNSFNYQCSWRTVEDSRPPIITLDSPECNDTNVDVLEPIVFSVIDVGDGVSQDSIKFSLEGIPVCSGLEFESLTTASGNGFTVTYTHPDDPFRHDSNVSVSVEATDLSPLENTAFFVCCFGTEESSVPDFINWDPAQCKTFVDNRTGLSFEVYGNLDGIDISELEVRIDNKLRKVFVRPRILRSE